MFGRDDPGEPIRLSAQTAPSSFEGVTKSVLKRIPALSGVRVVRQWSGPYDNTPDHNAIIDWTPLRAFWSTADGADTELVQSALQAEESARNSSWERNRS